MGTEVSKFHPQKAGFDAEPILNSSIAPRGRHPPFAGAPPPVANGPARPVSIFLGGIGIHHMSFETPESPLQPSLGERAIDAATDVSRTINDVSEGLRAAVDRLSNAIAASRRSGGALATVSAITREAPLTSLCVAFLLGVALARRR